MLVSFSPIQLTRPGGARVSEEGPSGDRVPRRRLVHGHKIHLPCPSVVLLALPDGGLDVVASRHLSPCWTWTGAGTDSSVLVSNDSKGLVGPGFGSGPRAPPT